MSCVLGLHFKRHEDFVTSLMNVMEEKILDLVFPFLNWRTNRICARVSTLIAEASWGEKQKACKVQNQGRAF